MNDEVKNLILESRFIQFVALLSLAMSVVNFVGFFLLFKLVNS